MFWSSRLKLGHSVVVVVHTRCSKPHPDDKEQTERLQGWVRLSKCK